MTTIVLRPKVGPGARILPMAVEVERATTCFEGADTSGWFGYVAGRPAFFPAAKWTLERATVATDPIPTREPNARGLSEITAALALAVEQRSIPGMTQAATELGAYSGDLLAALTACIGPIAYVLETTVPGNVYRTKAERAAKLILDLTGIDPAKERL